MSTVPAKRKAKRVRRVKAWLVVNRLDGSVLSTPGPHWYRESAAKEYPETQYDQTTLQVVPCTILYTPPRPAARRKVKAK